MNMIPYFMDASWIVKAVMITLLLASLVSWTIIFQRAESIKHAKKTLSLFEDKFWSGIELSQLYQQLKHHRDKLEGVSTIFVEAYQEFLRLQTHPMNPAEQLNNIQRAMRVAHARAIAKLENHLSFLATVGSTCPYVGLFGTVWGIMTSLQALGVAQQASIAMVAPGISEALVATALGLFAAIPAVIAYNRYTHAVDRLAQKYESFQDELTNILQRQLTPAPVLSKEA